MLPIRRSDRVLSWVLFAGFGLLVYRRVQRLHEIDKSLDDVMMRFVQAGESGKALLMQSEGRIRLL